MKNNFVIFLIFFLYFFSAMAYACHCMRDETSVIFNSASTVFIGQVLWGTEKMPESIAKRVYDNLPNELPEAGDVHFAVEEVFKGNIGNYVIVNFKNTGDDCDVWLVNGDRLIIYAYGKKSDGQVLRSGACSLGDPTNNRNIEELKLLRNSMRY